mmetsp:Transcript_37015/g.33280  ORF Transcript_37015/g.33280 Transcript_37015/m.33280 type:complete len:427 (-) Transcript_37015:28-1308(-)
MDSFKVYSSWIFTYYSQESFKFFISFVVGASSTGSIEFTTLLVVVVTSVFGGIFVGLEFINISSVGSTLGELSISLLNNASKFSKDSEFFLSGSGGLGILVFLGFAEVSGIIQKTLVSFLLLGGRSLDLTFLVDTVVHFVKMVSEGLFISLQVGKMVDQLSSGLLVEFDGGLFSLGVRIEGTVDFVSDFLEEGSDSFNGISIIVSGGIITGGKSSESRDSRGEGTDLSHFNTLLDELTSSLADLGKTGSSGDEFIEEFIGFIEDFDGFLVLSNSSGILGSFLGSLGIDSGDGVDSVFLVLEVELDVGFVVLGRSSTLGLMSLGSFEGSFSISDFVSSEVNFLGTLSLLLGSEGVVGDLFFLNISDQTINKLEDIRGGTLRIHHGSDLGQDGSHGSSGLEGRGRRDEDEGKDEEIGSHDFCELFFLV